MAEPQQQWPGTLGEGIKGVLPESGPSKSQVLAAVALLPVGGTLLFLAGITLVGTLIGLAVTAPLLVIFSPVLVPAALVIGFAVFAFLASGAFGVTALSSLSWMANYVRSMIRPQQLEEAKRRAKETAGRAVQRAREMGQTVQSKAQEATMGGQEGGKVQ